MNAIKNTVVMSSFLYSFELLEESLYLVHGTILRGKDTKAKHGKKIAGIRYSS